MKILTLAALGLALGACSCPPPKFEDQPGTIKNLSFMGAHSYEDCGAKRGCRREYVADRWYLNLCDKNGDCRTWTLSHAPWEWQKAGAAIKMHWRTYCSWGSPYWEVGSFEPIVP